MTGVLLALDWASLGVERWNFHFHYLPDSGTQKTGRIVNQFLTFISWTKQEISHMKTHSREIKIIVTRYCYGASFMQNSKKN